MANPNENRQNPTILIAEKQAEVACWFQRTNSTSGQVNDRWLLLSLAAGMNQSASACEIDFQHSCVMPGGFNPLHVAHLKMAQVARKRTGKPVFFELAINNIDKSSLELRGLQARIVQSFFPSGLIISRCPTFAEKSDFFPGTTFLVGADTIQRIGDLKYYNRKRQALDSAIARIAANHCRFLVFGRKIGNNFVESQKTNMCAELLAICDFVDRREFDMEISSTDIRRSTD